jgi:uncharacterized protein YbjT (DUF2867 family)
VVDVKSFKQYEEKVEKEESMGNMRSQPVLVTGSTGYVGGRLVPQLLSSGHRVRVLGRSLAKLQSRPWARDPLLEMVQADVLDLASLKKASQGCWAAFYLVHSMAAKCRISRYSREARDGRCCFSQS